MNRRLLYLIVAFLAFMGLVGGLYAAWNVYSPTKTVTVTDYALTISNADTCRVTETITFSGVLSLNGNPVEGETVELYLDDAATGLTDVTASDGSYSIVWTAGTVGTYQFYTKTVIT